MTVGRFKLLDINDFFDKNNTIVLKKSLKRFIDENTLNIHL